MKRLTVCAVLGLLFSASGVIAQGLQETMWASYTSEYNKDIAGAMKVLKSVEAREHDNYIVNLRLGWLAYLAGMWNESVAYYRQAAEIAPGSVEPLQGMLLPLAAANKTSEILKTHEAILKNDPNNYKSLSQLAWLHYTAKDYKKAIENYSHIVGLYPTDVEMLLGLGYSYKFSGNTDESSKIFQKVLLLSPKNPRALAGLK